MVEFVNIQKHINIRSINNNIKCCKSIAMFEPHTSYYYAGKTY